MIGSNVLTVMFVLFSIILLTGMIGDTDRAKCKNFTFGFIVSVIAIILLNN